MSDFYLDLNGSARERGLAHGEELRDVIKSAIERWQHDMAEAAKISFASLHEMFIDHMDYQVSIEQWTPHLIEEVQAVAVGSGLDDETIFAWQLVDEFIDFIVEYLYIEKCTTVGGYEQGVGLAPAIGKTQDLPHCYIGAHALVRTRYPNSDIDIYNSTIAGIICQDGMSRHLGVCLNHIGQLARNSSGLPVTFMTRLLLEQCTNIDQAHKLFSQITHASGMNYGLIDKHQVRSLEVSANHVEEYLPAPDLNRIWHTNHPLINQNYCRDIQTWNRLKDHEAGSTQARLDYLEQHASKVDLPLTVERIKEILSSREVPISSHAEDAFPTINSIVMEFTESPTLFFSPGPPSQEAYIPFTFD